MKFKILIFIILSSAAFSYTNGQNLSEYIKQIDSLKELSLRENFSAQKAELFNSISKKYADLLILDSLELYAEKALAAAEEEDNRRETAWANLWLAYLNKFKFARNISFSHCTTALEIFEEIGDYRGQIKALNVFGSGHYTFINNSSAEVFFKKAEKLLEENYFPDLAVETLSNLAKSFHIENKLQKADSLYMIVDTLAVRNKDLIGIFKNNARHAYTLRSLGKMDEAVEHMEKNLALIKNVENSLWTADTYNDIAVIFISAKKYEEALDFINKALAREELKGNLLHSEILYKNKIDALTNLGRFEEAFQAKVKESEFAEEKIRRLNSENMEVQKESERRESEKQTANIYAILLSSVIFILLIFLYSYWKLNRQRKSINRELEEKVRLRTEELSAKNEHLNNEIEKRIKTQEEIERNEVRLSSLLKVTQYESENIKDLLDYALHEAIKLTESRIGYIYRYDEEKKEFTLNSWSREVMKDCKILEPETIYQLENTGVWGEAVRQRKPIVMNEFQAPHDLKKGYPEGHVTLKKYMTIPVFRENKIVAVVGVGNKENDYTDEDIENLTLFMNSVWTMVERKLTDEKLEEYLQLNEKLISSSLLGVLAYDSDGNCVLANEAAANTVGGKVEDLMNQNYNNLESWKKFGLYNIAKDVMENGSVQKDELEIVTSFGRSIWLEIMFSRFEMQNSNHLLLLFEDVSERKEWEKENLKTAERVARQRSALTTIAARKLYTEKDFKSELKNLMRLASETCEVKRSSVWFLDEKEETLECIVIYDAGTDEHSKGICLKVEDYPRYFSALKSDSRIDAHDAFADERTSELEESYLNPLGITSMLDVAIFIEGRIVGMVCLEHIGDKRHWHSDEEAFVSTIAALISDMMNFYERKKVEEVLKESEYFLQKSQSIAGIGSYSFDIVNETWQSSAALDGIFGIDGNYKKDVEGWGRLIHDDDKYEIIDYLSNHVIKDKNKFDKEYRIQRNDTLETRWVHGIGDLEMDSEGNPVKMIGTVQDITDRRNADEKIRKNEAMLRETIESSPIAILLTTNGIEVDYMNPKFQDLFGYNHDDIPSVHEWWPLAYPDEAYREEIISEWGRRMEEAEKNNSQIRPMEAVVRCKDGSERTIEFSTSTIGEKVLVVFVDVSEQRSYQKRIEESEKKYRLLFENMTAGFALHEMIYNEDGKPVDYRYIEANPEFERLTGVKADDIIGKTVKELLPNTEDYWIEQSAKVAETGESLQYENYSQEIKKHFSSFIFSPKQGQFATVFYDISEQKLSEEKINLMNEELKSHIETKDKFFSIIAHDLKSPLQGLLGMTNILKDEFDDLNETDSKELIHSINEISEGTYSLIENLLSWSRLQTGKFNYSPENIHLYSLVRNTIKPLSKLAGEKGIDIKIQIDHNLFFNADPNMMELIVRNLVSNAIKFSYKNGEINIKAVNGGTDIQLCVEDKGTGMDEDQLADLFNPAKQKSTSGTNRERGSGLGLQLCSEMIRMHKGTIEVQSKPKKGSKFTVSIPA